MISTNMLLVSLESHIIRENVHHEHVFPSINVLLLTKEEAVSGNGSGCLYVADAETAREILADVPDAEGLLIFTAGDLPDAEALSGANGAQICCTDLRLAQLHNRLCRTVELFNLRQKSLGRDVNADNAFSVIFNGGALAESSVYFLSSRYQILAGYSRPEYVSRLQGIIDYNNSSVGDGVLPLFRESDDSHNGCSCMTLEDGLRLYGAVVGESRCIHGYLLAASGGEPDTIRQLTLQIAASLGHFLAQGGAFDRTRLSFQALAEKLFLPTQLPANLDELQLQLQRLPNVPKKYMRGILLRPGAEFSSKLGELAEAAAQLIPKSNVAILNGDLFILISSKYNLCPLPCGEEDFNAFLESCGAYAIIGNPAKTTKTLRMMYLQCRAVFDVTIKVQYQITERFFYFERFSQYYIIDICARYLQQELGTDDMVFLCNPGVLAVTRYDRTNQSDLRDVLFNYLMNRCSIAKTAEAMFMHRNTVVYKLNKIEEILGHPMDDPYLRHSLIFSCMLIRYWENYRGKSIALDVFERTTPE